MPYNYVIEAFEFLGKKRKRQLHEEEAPIALQTSLLANSNRDTKKKKEPYVMEDFFLYQPREDKNIPTSTFGSAAMELIKRKIYPSWALFVFKDLKQSASGPPPSLLAFMGDNVLLLAPIVKENTVKGMLIANESVYGETVEMTSPCGKTITAVIPTLIGRYSAEENIEMQVTSKSGC